MLSGRFMQYIAQFRYPGLLTMLYLSYTTSTSYRFKYVLSRTCNGAVEGAAEGCTIISMDLVVEVAPQ